MDPTRTVLAGNIKVSGVMETLTSRLYTHSPQCNEHQESLGEPEVSEVKIN